MHAVGASPPGAATMAPRQPSSVNDTASATPARLPHHRHHRHRQHQACTFALLAVALAAMCALLDVAQAQPRMCPNAGWSVFRNRCGLTIFDINPVSRARSRALFVPVVQTF